MKIFWSWQSDIDGKISRHFIKKCLKKAVEELKEEAVFNDRVEIDHDTKDIPGSPAITDTILDKIKNSSVFVADVTPVAQVKKSKKKIINSNVAIETGYAIALLGNNKIISILNESFGSLGDLPFDLKYKRGPIKYILKNNAEKKDAEKQEKILIAKLKIALKNYVDSCKNLKNQNNFDLDKNGEAIFFDSTKPILRRPSDGWALVKDKSYKFNKSKSYIYSKIIPTQHFDFSKKKIEKAMFDNSNFKIHPLFNLPDNTPEVNKYGCILVHLNKENNLINDFVQILKNGSIISVANSLLYYSKNKIPLVRLRNCLIKNLKEGILVLKSMIGENEETEVTIEIGIINGNNCTLLLPKPVGNKYYPEPERGPLENEKYILNKKIKLRDIEKVDEIIKEFILSLLDDIGIKFDYEDHQWS